MRVVERIAGESQLPAKRELDEAREQARELQRQLRDAQRDIERLQRENEDLLEQLRVAAAAHADAIAGSDGAVAVSSVREAVDAAGRLPGLRFLPSAAESADESPFERPDDVYTALRCLSELASLRSRGGIGMSVADWLQDKGVAYSPFLGREKDMFRFKEKYLFDVDGERVPLEEHIKFGVGKNPYHCLRIYMKWDEDGAEWIVGHVGEHIRNAKA